VVGAEGLEPPTSAL